MKCFDGYITMAIKALCMLAVIEHSLILLNPVQCFQIELSASLAYRFVSFWSDLIDLYSREKFNPWGAGNSPILLLPNRKNGTSFRNALYVTPFSTLYLLYSSRLQPAPNKNLVSDSHQVILGVKQVELTNHVTPSFASQLFSLSRPDT